jgi:AcrR family transcriptional regulator
VAHRPDTRAALLAATEALVDERGPSGVTLREVARRVGVSHGAPLKHFRGLAELLTAVAADGFRALQAAVAGGMAEAGEDPLARLAGAGRGYVTCATARPGMFALMFRRDVLVPDDPDLVTEGAAAFAQLVDAIHAAQAANWQAHEPTLVLAGALWSSMHGVAQLWSQGALPRATRNRDLAMQLDVCFRALGLPTMEGDHE